MLAPCLEVRLAPSPVRSGGVLHLSTATCLGLVLLICGLLAIGGLLLVSTVGRHIGRGGGGVGSFETLEFASGGSTSATHELAEQRARTVDLAIVALSRRIAALAKSTRSSYNNKPWLADCTSVYNRTDVEQEEINIRAEEQHTRAQTWLSIEHNRYVKELQGALNAVEQNWLPAIAHWLMPELDALNFKARPVNIECTKHAVVMIEGRFNKAILFMIRHTFFMLEQDTQRWGLILFHGPNNEAELVEALEIYPGGAGEHIQLHLINETLMDRNLGNKAIVAPVLWELIPTENVLLLQTDGLMLKPPSTNLTLWHSLTNDYVYVGAPLPHPSINPTPNYNRFGSQVHTPYGGNGGVSFRKKSVMLEIARSIRCTNPAGTVGDCYQEHHFPATPFQADEYTDLEDRWIGKQLWKFAYRYRHRIPFYDVSKKFAIDMIFYKDPFFCHKFWQAKDHHLQITDADVLAVVAPMKTYYVSAERQQKEDRESESIAKAGG